jgi:translation initiation factor 2 alpha subunit (eIF-2alpha)
MEKHDLEENDVVLCTVKRIEKTTVFLEIEGLKGIEATMIFSEVSPGRIRNIRDYIAINKKIVCKVLRLKGENIELSLRRVKGKERDDVLDRHKKEKTLQSIIRPVLKEKTTEILEKIRVSYDLADFLDEARENPDLIEKFVPKSYKEALKKILKEKREKEKSVNLKISLRSMSESGIKDIKSILMSSQNHGTEDAEIHYLGSSTFSIQTKAKDYKTANSKIESLIEKLKEKAKKLNAKLEVK